MSTIPIRRYLSAEDLARAKARKANRIEAQVESSKERLMTKARQRKVPATRFERATTFGTAGVGLAANFVKNKIVRRVFKLLLARWRSQPIKYRVRERQPITERLKSYQFEISF